MTEINEDRLPLLVDPFPWLDTPEPEESQRRTLEEIASQIFEIVEEALRQDSIWDAIAVIANGERVVAKYTEVHFNLLEPFQKQLQGTLTTVWRMTRRRFFRAALRAPQHEHPKYMATIREGWLTDDDDALADFQAALRNVDEGASLFGDLRK